MQGSAGAQEAARNNTLMGLMMQAQQHARAQETVLVNSAGWAGDAPDQEEAKPVLTWLAALKELHRRCTITPGQAPAAKAAGEVQVKQEPQAGAATGPSGSSRHSSRAERRQEQQAAREREGRDPEQPAVKRARRAGTSPAPPSPLLPLVDYSSEDDSAYHSAQEDQQPSQQEAAGGRGQGCSTGSISFEGEMYQQHGLRMAVEALRELGSMYVPARLLVKGELLPTVRAFTRWPTSAVAHLASRLLQQWRRQLAGCLTALGEPVLLQDPVGLLDAKLRSGEVVLPRPERAMGKGPGMPGPQHRTPKKAAAGAAGLEVAPSTGVATGAPGTSATMLGTGVSSGLAMTAGLLPVGAGQQQAGTPWSAPAGRVLAFNTAVKPPLGPPSSAGTAAAVAVQLQPQEQAAAAVQP